MGTMSNEDDEKSWVNEQSFVNQKKPNENDDDLMVWEKIMTLMKMMMLKMFGM